MTADLKGSQPAPDQPELAGVRRFLDHRSLGIGLFVEAGQDSPDLEALRWAVELAHVLGDPAHEESVAFVIACRREEDGFAIRAEDDRPTLAATYYGVRVLELLDRRDLLPRNLSRWIEQQVIGVAGTVTVDIDELFYALRALEHGGQPLSDRLSTRTAEFITACEHSGGGFGPIPGAPPHIEQTYCCLRMRQLLGHGDRFAAHADWVARCCRDGEFLPSPAASSGTLATAYWGTQAAGLCHLELPAAEVRHQVRQRRNPDGGFGDGGTSNLWSTYCALRVLWLLTGR